MKRSLIAAAAMCLPLCTYAAQSEVKAVPADSSVRTTVEGKIQPPVSYANLWADDKGETHIGHCRLEGLDYKSYAPPAAPQWIGVSPDQVESIAYAVLPPGYVGSWHSAPGPQWVITLSGKWSVESSDGSKLVQGPGEMQFNGDHGAKGKGGHNGHISRTLGTEPNVQLIIKLKAGAKVPQSAMDCQY